MSTQLAQLDNRANAVLSLLSSKGCDGLMCEGVSDVARHRVNAIAKTWREALENYQAKFSKLPPRDLLASAHGALERLLGKDALDRIPQEHRPLMEAAAGDMSTSGKGVDRLAHYAAIYLPALLAQETINLASWVDCSRGQRLVEVVQLVPVTTTAFGGVDAGKELPLAAPDMFYTDFTRTGPFDGTPDGTEALFYHTQPDKMAIKPGTLRVRIDNKVVSGYDDPANGFVDVTGHPDYNGARLSVDNSTSPAPILTLDFTNAKQKPAAGTVLAYEYCIDDEWLANYHPELMPGINFRMRKIQHALKNALLRFDTTVMAAFDAQREMGVDLGSLATQVMIGIMSGDYDLGRVMRLALTCTDHSDIALDLSQDDGVKANRKIYRTILGLNSDLGKKANFLGASSIVAGEEIGSWLMNHPTFIPAVQSPSNLMPGRVTRVGYVFGMELFVVPKTITDAVKSLPTLKLTEKTVILVANDGNGRAPLVAGDAIPPVPLVERQASPNLKSTSVLITQTLGGENIDGSNYCISADITITE